MRVEPGNAPWAQAPILNDDGTYQLRLDRRRQCAIPEAQFSAGLMLEIAAFIQLGEGRKQQMLQFQRSLPGDFFGWHLDTSPARPATRVAILYLSDKESHGLVGGETEFSRPGEGRLKVTPKQGKAVVWDAGLRHRSHKVSKGVKYALVGVWL